MWAVVTPGRSRAVRRSHRRWSPAMTVSSGGPLEVRSSVGGDCRAGALRNGWTRREWWEAYAGPWARDTARESLAVARTCVVGGGAVARPATKRKWTERLAT